MADQGCGTCQRSTPQPAAGKVQLPKHTPCWCQRSCAGWGVLTRATSSPGMWDAAVGTEIILPNMCQPDGSWAEVGVDKCPYPAPTACLCCSLDLLLPWRHLVLETALGLHGQVLVVGGCMGGFYEKTPEAALMLGPASCSHLQDGPITAQRAKLVVLL